MGGFFCRRGNDGEERWGIEVTGKGDKTRIVPATFELMVELNRYRKENRLTPFPLPSETTPLLLPIVGKPPPLTRSAVHLTVKEVFARASERMRQREHGFQHLALLLEEASAHWLRHTAGSNMAGSDHESISTTSQYLHSKDDLRHKETEENHRLGW
jgi:integrase/recombinase XerD